MPKFSTVIFDLDGLVSDTEPIHRRAFNMVLHACGANYEYDAEEYGRTITGHVIFENAERIRERFGLPQSAQEIANAHRALMNLLIADAENIRAMPGLLELLAYLENQKIRTAIASSSRPEQIHTVLRGLNLNHKFQTIVGLEENMKPKPAPDVYLHAVERLGASPAETLALEDSPSGVRAAKAAGLTIFAVPNDYTRMHEFPAADGTFADLNAVRDYLASA